MSETFILIVMLTTLNFFKSLESIKILENLAELGRRRDKNCFTFETYGGQLVEKLFILNVLLLSHECPASLYKEVSHCCTFYSFIQRIGNEMPEKPTILCW